MVEKAPPKKTFGVSGTTAARVQPIGTKKVSTAAPAEEEKKAKTGFTGKPSDRLTKVKTADPFAASSKKHKTNFGYVY